MRGLHGNEAAEQLYVNSLQGLSVLLLPRDVPVRMRSHSCTHTADARVTCHVHMHAGPCELCCPIRQLRVMRSWPHARGP